MYRAASSPAFPLHNISPPLAQEAFHWVAAAPGSKAAVYCMLGSLGRKMGGSSSPLLIVVGDCAKGIRQSWRRIILVPSSFFICCHYLFEEEEGRPFEIDPLPCTEYRGTNGRATHALVCCVDMSHSFVSVILPLPATHTWTQKGAIAVGRKEEGDRLPREEGSFDNETLPPKNTEGRDGGNRCPRLLTATAAAREKIHFTFTKKLSPSSSRGVEGEKLTP